MKEVKKAQKHASENSSILIGSISTSTSLQMWQDLAKMMEDQGIHMLELNFGCPSLTKTKAGSEIGKDRDYGRRSDCCRGKCG